MNPSLPLATLLGQNINSEHEIYNNLTARLNAIKFTDPWLFIWSPPHYKFDFLLHLKDSSNKSCQSVVCSVQDLNLALWCVFKITSQNFQIESVTVLWSAKLCRTPTDADGWFWELKKNENKCQVTDESHQNFALSKPFGTSGNSTRDVEIQEHDFRGSMSSVDAVPSCPQCESLCPPVWQPFCIPLISPAALGQRLPRNKTSASASRSPLPAWEHRRESVGVFFFSYFLLKSGRSAAAFGLRSLEECVKVKLMSL